MPPARGRRSDDRPEGLSLTRARGIDDRVDQGMAAHVGLPLSGMIYDRFGWHAVFWASLAMAVVMLVLVVTVVPESTVMAPGSFDLLGAALLSVGLTALLLGISKGHTWGWTSRWTMTSFAIATLALLAWAMWELRTGHPLVDLRTSARRPVLLTNVASFLAGFALFANLLVATMQLQLPVSTGVGLGLGVTAAGLAMLPGGALMVVMAPVSAAITRRFGARSTLVSGLVITGCGYVLRVFLDSSLAWLVLGISVVSLGIAVCFAAMPVLIMRSVPIADTASANGLNTVVRSIGTATCSAGVTAVLAANSVAVDGSGSSDSGCHAHHKLDCSWRCLSWCRCRCPYSSYRHARCSCLCTGNGRGRYPLAW